VVLIHIRVHYFIQDRSGCHPADGSATGGEVVDAVVNDGVARPAQQNQVRIYFCSGNAEVVQCEGNGGDVKDETFS